MCHQGQSFMEEKAEKNQNCKWKQYYLITKPGIPHSFQAVSGKMSKASECAQKKESLKV